MLISYRFNIMMIHQNRIKHTQLQKNFVSEKMLPGFLDLVCFPRSWLCSCVKIINNYHHPFVVPKVIWAHEHECLIDPVESTEAYI